MTDLFSPFSLEFLSALEQLSGVMDVIYVGQLSPEWGIRGHALSQFPKIWRVFTEFLIWPNFGQKKVPKDGSKISRIDQASNTEIGVRPLYLCPILHSFYRIRYMVSFWYGNNLLEGDLKKTEPYQNIRGQQVVRLLLFYLEKFNQIDS